MSKRSPAVPTGAGPAVAQLRTMSQETEYVSSGAVARHLGISVRTVQRAVLQKRIVPSHFTPGGHPRFLLADVILNLAALGLAPHGRESRDHLFHVLTEDMPLLVAITDENGIVRYASPSHKTILGIDPATMVGTSGYSLLHPDDQTTVQAAPTLTVGPGIAPLLRVRHMDGTWHWIEITAVDKRHDPLLSGFVLTSRDVTDRVAAEQLLREKEQQYRRIVESAQEGICQIDPQHRTTFVNQRMADLLGYSVDEMQGLSFWAVIPPEEIELVERSIEQSKAGQVGQREGRYRRKDGTLIWVSVVRNSLFDERGTYLGTQLLVTDITTRKAAEAVQAHLAAIVSSSADAILSKDLEGKITSWNAGAERLYGYSAREALGQSVTMLLLPDGPDETPIVRAAIRRGEAITINETLRQHKDGHAIPVSVSVSPILDATGTIIGDAAIVRDITELKRAEEALRHQALHDALTDLPNRTLLYDRMEQALCRVQRDHSTLALLLLDLDNFKDVNDAFGHHYGDQLLRQVAQRLTTLLRASDTIARLGGDEFAILLPDTGLSAASAIAIKIGAALETRVVIGDASIQVSASIGIAVWPDHGTDGPTLLRHADVAMYSAKHNHTLSAVYHPTKDHETSDRLSLITDLRSAISQRMLVLHYQPKVSLATGRVVGVEALIRWPHPERGLVRPDQFIPLAEQTGLIRPLTEWVLHEALRQWRAWSDAGLDIPVAVNLSMLNLHDQELPECIGQLLTIHRAPPSALRLEITETAAMTDTTQTQHILARLTEMGLMLSIDDYGAGYSSLAYLRHLPVDELKIDMTFVRQMIDQPADAAIVASTIALGHNLGLWVVAEGVETLEHWMALQKMGCDLVQGYHISPPQPAEDLERWLRAYEGEYTGVGECLTACPEVSTTTHRQHGSDDQQAHTSWPSLHHSKTRNNPTLLG